MSRSSSATTRPSPNRTASGCTTCWTTRSTCCPPGRRERWPTLRDATWIAGCERCRSHLLSLCANEGFAPRIAYTTDDMVVLQSLVAAGLGVTTIPGLALRAHRVEGIAATELRRRRVTSTPRPTVNRPTRPPPPRSSPRSPRQPS